MNLEKPGPGGIEVIVASIKDQSGVGAPNKYKMLYFKICHFKIYIFK